MSRFLVHASHKLSAPIIRIDPDEELNLICKFLFYRPTGYHSNAKALRDACKKEGYNFPYKKIRKWLHNQNEWQKYAPSPKNTPRGKTWKAVLQIIDVSSRFKASVPLTSKNSSEVAKAFKKIYDNPNNPLTYPTLLQCDQDKEFMGETARLMEAHNVTIRVIGAYSHRGLALSMGKVFARSH
ncbi:3091_t:CDS:2 [Paraglomus brasilianum]|uniref:3091_t:CDS:1 n=1 Tax=Paraglomus brasilianum TaxID=144538 RepID=A0A9N9CPZ5_9GLOM|nr:3091_t:CDS:2 [Paraglomus brasilianum]